MDDDPIVREIPVHLADELRRNLYMVQFPLRPTYRPMPEPPHRARIKPQNQLMQLDFPVDQRSEHFDQDAEDYIKQKHLRLQSSSVPALSNYAVGVFRQGQLHLTPLTSIMQMRPSLSHIDDAANEEEEDLEEKIEPPPAELKEVQFQFKKKQSERAISAIQNSYAYKKQQIDAENWIELQVQDKNSCGAEEEFENLFSEKEEEVVSTMTPDQYIKALQYRTVASDDKTASNNPAHVHTDDEEKEDAMDFIPQILPDGLDTKYLEVQRLLKTDQIMHFDMLATLLPTLSEKDICDALKHIAIHARGRLLPISALVCRGETMVRTRNYIIQALSQAPNGVTRTELAETFSLDADAVKTILSGKTISISILPVVIDCLDDVQAEVAVLESTTRTWKFRLGPDDSFIQRFPTLAKAIKL